MSPNPSVQLVANATPTRWSQAYSTLNLYIVLHLGGDDVARVGKELLERVQRSYFALDEKSLSNIKDAVQQVVDDIDPSFDYSLTVATTVESVLYVVVASCGRVALLRDGQCGIVAEGARGACAGFSGHVQDGDVLLIGTCDFFEKMGTTPLSDLSGRGVHDIAELLAPEIHTDATGGEAAIVVQIGDTPIPAPEPEEQIEPEVLPEPRTTNSRFSILKTSIPALFQRFLHLIRTRRRESLIVGAIVVLLILFGVLLVRDRAFQQAERASSVLASIQGEVDELLENADAMSGVEPSRAIQFLQEAEQIVTEKRNSVEAGSIAHQELSALLADISKKLDALEGGERVNLSSFFENGDYSDPFVAAGEEDIYIASGRQVARLSADGDIEDEVEIEADVLDIYALDDFVYVLTEDEVIQVDGGNFATEIITETGGIDISAFGGNAYILGEGDILRSSGGSYFEDSPLSGAVSLAIDGAIYVFENGEIYKFLRGEGENFNVEGLVTPLGENSQLYTTAELDDLYVLDPENSRVVVLSKEGEYRELYRNEVLADAVSFAVQGGSVYVSSPDGIFTFEL